MLALAGNFVVSPLLIATVAYVFSLQATPSLMIGIILFGIIPCGGMVPAYTGMLGGNVSLSVTITAVSLLLSVVIVPFWAETLIGQVVPVPTLLILKYLIVIIIAPMLLAVFTRTVIRSKLGPQRYCRVKEYLKVLVGYGLMLFLFIVFVLNGDMALNNPTILLKTILSSLTFLVLMPAFVTLLARLARLRREDSVALTISCCAKNNAVAVALAASTFGPEPAMVIAVTGPLVQLPVMLGYIQLGRWAIGASRRSA
jgi:ACR3 family arsenite efflux pump ArsB